MTPIIQFINVPNTIPGSPIVEYYDEFAGGTDEFCSDIEQTFKDLTEAKLIRFLRWVHMCQPCSIEKRVSAFLAQENIHPTARLMALASMCDRDQKGNGTLWLCSLANRLIGLRDRPLVSDLIVIPNRGDFIVDTTKIPRAYCHYQLRKDRPRFSESVRSDFRDQRVPRSGGRPYVEEVG